MQRLFISLIIIVVGMQNLFAQNIELGVLIGKVSDKSGPLPDVNILLKLEEQTKGGVTDKDGLFKIDRLIPGDYDIIFTYIGYKSFIYKNYTIKSGENNIGTIFLQPGSSDGEERSTIVKKTDRLNAPDIKYRVNGVDYNVGVRKYDVDGGIERDFSNPSQTTLKATAHNDNEEYPFYLDYLKTTSTLGGIYRKNLEDRLTIRFVDSQNHPVWNLPFKITNKQGIVLWEGKTYANGENVIFPHAFISRDNQKQKLRRFISAKINTKPEFIVVNDGSDEYKLNYSHNRLTKIQLPDSISRESFPIEILFILDATGSMGDEIRQLKDNLYSIYTRINNSFENIPLRFGLVEYRDKTDEYVTKIHQFTDDVDKFQQILDDVKAKGGGDGPEDLQSALEDALHKIQWNEKALKLSFLVGDARPHIDYGQDFTYIDAAMEANMRGIKLYAIGASGLDRIGEYVFRQISALTYSEFIFLTYGETGESDGSTGPGRVSHHTGSNYSSQALDDLVVDIIRKEVSYQLPESMIVHNDVKPENQESFLRLRMNNLWTQINKQIEEVTGGTTVGLIPIFKTTIPELIDFAQYLQNLSIDLIVESNQMTLVERDRLEEILKEHGLSMAGIIEDGQYGEIGKLTKADIVFLGSIDYAGIDRVVMVRGVRLEDGRIIAAARVRI